MNNIIDTFKAAMHEAGINPPDIVNADGVIHRFHNTGDRKNSENGWYILHPDFPQAGSFGDWKRDIKKTFCVPIHQNHTTELIQQADRIGKIQHLMNREQERRPSVDLWEGSLQATDNCGYLLKKRVRSHGLRYHGNAVIVPVSDCDGVVHGVQRIWPDGTKKFTAGAAMRGNFHLIGQPGGTLLIAEGYATAATLYECTGHAAVVAFYAGNMLPVAQAIRRKYPDTIIIMCADDDSGTGDNPGLTAATAAARTVNGLLAVPVFQDMTTKPSDFNDLFCLEGADIVRRIVSLSRAVDHA